MDGLSDWVQVIVAIVALLGLLWRFETRISGSESRLGERIAHLEASSDGLSSRLSRIENVLDQFLMRTGRGSNESTQWG